MSIDSCDGLSFSGQCGHLNYYQVNTQTNICFMKINFLQIHSNDAMVFIVQQDLKVVLISFDVDIQSPFIIAL